MYGNRGQQVKGCVDRPGTDLYSYCTEPEAVNRFCGILAHGHDEGHCHKMSEKRGTILKRMKAVIGQLERNMKPCEQWDTWPTSNNTTGPHRFGFYQPRGKPWDLNRVKSKELVASKLTRNCECLRKNGLQDDCPRLQCRGRAWCMEEPFPLCPPFTNFPREPCDPDPYSVCPRRPWEQQTDYKTAPTCVGDPLTMEYGKKERYDPSCCSGADAKADCWKLRCPTTGETHNYQITNVRTEDLPDSLHGKGPVFKLSHATSCPPRGVCPPK